MHNFISIYCLEAGTISKINSATNRWDVSLANRLSKTGVHGIYWLSMTGPPPWHQRRRDHVVGVKELGTSIVLTSLGCEAPRPSVAQHSSLVLWVMFINLIPAARFMRYTHWAANETPGKNISRKKKDIQYVTHSIIKTWLCHRWNNIYLRWISFTFSICISARVLKQSKHNSQICFLYTNVAHPALLFVNAKLARSAARRPPRAHWRT